MINRTLIRLKVVQLIYAYYQDEGKSLETAEKELQFSLSKAYDLYNLLLLLMVAVTKYARKQVSQAEELNRTMHTDNVISHKFIDNKFIAQLEANLQLRQYCEDKKKSWDNEIIFIKHIYEIITGSEIYAEYMSAETESYADDREFWRAIYKHVIMKDEDLDDVLEEQSLYWNDDREIVDTFILKTIKRFEEEKGDQQELMPEYKDVEDLEFARRLFSRTIRNSEYYRDLIVDCVKNWEFDRMAFMDLIIMQIAVAEIMSFPLIPVSVTINEYIEIAKWYSTPHSGRYINGVLDAVAKKLQKEKKLMKK